LPQKMSMKWRNFVLILTIVFLFLSILLLIPTKISPSSYFLFLPSAFTLLFSFLLLFVYLVFSEKKEGIKERYELPSPFVETVENLYEILKKGGEKNWNAERILSQIFPFIEKIVREYSDALRKFDRSVSGPFFDIYYSVEGKHSHYYIKRLVRDIRHLKNSCEEIIKYASKRVY